jgi:hypothetical protein
MQDIKTAHWVETHTLWERDDGEEDTFPIREWIRLDPPARAWQNDHDGSWSYDVVDERGRLHTVSTWKHCSLDPDYRPPDPKVLLQDVLFSPPVADDSVDPFPSQRRVEWQHEQVEMDGVSLVKWYREYTHGNFGVVESVWTEPQTHRIVRKESRETNLLTGKPAILEVCDRYTYNEEPPEGTFEMPADKPIITHEDKDLMPEVWDTLSATEQQAIQKTIDRSDAGWQNADFQAFASVWDFDFQSHLPRQLEWQSRVRQQAGLWNRWNSEVESAITMDCIPVRIARTSFTFAMRPKRKVLWVKVKLNVAWSEEESAWEDTAEFYIRRKGRGYRIVHWDFRGEQIKAERIRVP